MTMKNTNKILSLTQKVVHISSFSYHGGAGNPAGVLDVTSERLTDDEMIEIAAQIGYSETAFITHIDLEARPVMLSLRYFTPVGEVDLCGHATIATCFYLDKLGMFKTAFLQANTKAGCISLRREQQRDVTCYWMSQASPIMKPFPKASFEKLSRALKSDLSKLIAENLPIVIGSTGLSDILIPVKSREHLNTISIVPQLLASLSDELSVTGAHLFTITSEGIYARNFAPLYGIDEECATGTSNGVLIHYLHHYCYPTETELERHILQGEAMGRTSLIMARTDIDHHIEVGGTCVYLR